MSRREKTKKTKSGDSWGAMPAQPRKPKAAHWTVIAGLGAISFVLAGGPAFAANPCEPCDSGLRPGGTARCSGPAPTHGAGGHVADYSGGSVAPPLIVSVSHHLAKREAVRRVKSGVDGIQRNYGLLFSVQEETWTDDQLRFRVTVLGLPISGSIDVTDHLACLEAFLPWLLAPLAEAAKPAIHREGVSILEGRK